MCSGILTILLPMEPLLRRRLRLPGSFRLPVGIPIAALINPSIRGLENLSLKSRKSFNRLRKNNLKTFNYLNDFRPSDLNVNSRQKRLNTTQDILRPCPLRESCLLISKSLKDLEPSSMMRKHFY